MLLKKRIQTFSAAKRPSATNRRYQSKRVFQIITAIGSLATNKVNKFKNCSNFHLNYFFLLHLGYSGVGLLSRVKPIKVTYGIEDKKFDNEGRVITAEYENYYVINSCKTNLLSFKSVKVHYMFF